MPAPAPTQAPPNFYDQMPPAGDTASGKTGAGKDEKDGFEEVLKGFQGIYKVARKLEALDKDKIKPLVQPIKDAVKNAFVKLGKDPSILGSDDDKDKSDAGGDSGAGADSGGSNGSPNGSPVPPPSQSDSTHAA